MQINEKALEDGARKEAEIDGRDFDALGRADKQRYLARLSDAIRAYLEAATPPDVAGLTPLEWSLTWGPDEDGDECHTASTPFGSYTVERIDGRWKWKYCFSEYYDEDEQSCTDLEEGQKAAQDHWNDRVAPIFDTTALRLSAGGGEKGQWKEIETTFPQKGRRTSPAYFPATGEVCEVSGPNCDDANGYTWMNVTVLWQNEKFVLYGLDGFWPNLHKREHVLFRPLPASPTVEAGHAE